VTEREERRGKQLIEYLKEKKNTENWKKKHYIAPVGEFAL
jgi:hypothetical protein